MQATLNNNERTRCEVWTRVMGYHRPVSEFNPGKKSEHAERQHFIETRSCSKPVSMILANTEAA